MVRGRQWTGFEAAALQEAMRKSVRDFASLLGVEATTVVNWRGGLGRVRPRSNTQELLDTTLDQRATADDRARFDQILEEGEAAWRARHPIAPQRQMAPLTLNADDSTGPAADTSPVTVAFRAEVTTSTVDEGRSAACVGDGFMEMTDMNRRELLRSLTIATTTLTTASAIDWARVRFAIASGRVDAATVEQYAHMNRLLWRDFSETEMKARLFNAVRGHLAAMVDGLRNSASGEVRGRQLELIADSLQLIGEIMLDSDHLADAAYCYALSGSFAAEANAHDLWACALTRHAYIGIIDSRFADVLPLAEEAAEVVRHGDTHLPTRFWIYSVRAQIQAGLGNQADCERSFESARGISGLAASPSLGWLRFTGGRLDEEEASCMVRLRKTESAERLLTPLLDHPLSIRRRGSVLVDLAAVGALRSDPVQTVWFGGTAADIARRTRSGYLARRLEQLRPHLEDLRQDRHVAHLEQQISTLTMSPAH
ncbi:hypothetical protein NONO_c16630 [Nocardia nova SH22a]|uniref:Uncharacterized protein n=1 Tax=Nocardia nova SH22a TaxID=1415166 RepID=W5TBE8_9NOCA|nr:hypothetical protein [Nocardia nova]AHH16464.1 hypothetical protein NONO_c16630 [Nocardia nova SH22a]